ncbi:hypothetical protein [Xanthomonas pisi]|uniref:hypothetical protein n=1 Tax=Xanthomonas pisi TaxID=56457 RepID=UPI0011B02362|nr:hypothetical protein [Xanthomonas pisi]
MPDPRKISALEASHLAYDVFIFTVETLSFSPEKQCEAMGDYNTAWEIRDDALAGHYLIGSSLFTEQQESAVLAFLAAVHSVPVNDMPAGSGRAPNLAAMQHPAWEAIRSSAAGLLAALASSTEANRAFLAAQAPAP